jgi:hypothetical protein
LTLVIFVAFDNDLLLLYFIPCPGTLQALRIIAIWLFKSVSNKFLLNGVLGLVLFLVQVLILLRKELVDVRWLEGLLILSDFDFVQEAMLVVVSYAAEGYSVKHGKIVQHFLIFSNELIVVELISQLLHQVLRKGVVDVALLVLRFVVAVGRVVGRYDAVWLCSRRSFLLVHRWLQN